MISVIVPVYNSSQGLVELLTSLDHSDIFSVVDEVLCIDDGSTDDIARMFESFKLASAYSDRYKFVASETNRGRFVARLKGAQIAKSESVLFLDSRVKVSPDFGSKLKLVTSGQKSVMGTVKIDIAKSVYNLYWQRTHEFLFRKNYEDAKAGFYITPSNFDLYVKGTTVFFCHRNLFIDACGVFKSKEVLNDDTALLKQIAAAAPIYVSKELSVDWEPRQKLSDFLHRMWERGPQFVEYHVFTHRRRFFYFWLLALLYLIVTAISMFISLKIFLPLVAFMIFVPAASTGVFSKSVEEFFKLIPLQLVTVVTFGFATLMGVFVNLRMLKRPSPAGASSPPP